jgi:predicted RNase H-like nuclease (RuvC/YqgF family)
MTYDTWKATDMSFEQDPYEREDEEIRRAFAEKDEEIARLKSELSSAASEIAWLKEQVQKYRKLGFEMVSKIG